jgi:hypothetical protein
VIVSNRCGCAEDLVRNRVNGFVFDPSDNDALSTLFSHMEQMHPDKLLRMAEASSQIISGFSPESWAGEVARIVAA